MSPWVVLKFGGTSVSSRESWDTIARIIRARRADGERVCVVCSAASGTSRALEGLIDAALHGNYEEPLTAIGKRHLALAHQLGLDGEVLLQELLQELERLAYGASLTRDVGPPLHARILSMGELMLTTLGTAFLKTQDFQIHWMDARTILKSEPIPRIPPHEEFLSAQCNHDPDPELQQVDADIFITQGFIASDAQDRTVLTGWGGSDTSAAYFASKLEAIRLEIWTDVPGMFTANPGHVPGARLLKQLEYSEAQELASSGAEVLHPRCIEPLRPQKIPLHVRSTANPDLDGTVISAETHSYGAQVKAIAACTDLILIAVETPRMWHSVGFLAKICTAFERHGLSIGMVATSETNVTLSIDPVYGFSLEESVIEALLADLNEFCQAKCINGCAAVSMVGQNIRSVLHELGPALEVLDEQKIYLVTQAASDLNFTFVVDNLHAQRLTNKLHSQIFSQIGPDDLFGATYRELFDAPDISLPTSWWKTRRDQLLELAAESSPCYVYDRESLDHTISHMQTLQSADRSFYAMKACWNPEVLQVIYEHGIGFECVSPGELHYIRHLFPDIDPDRILFTPNFVPKEEFSLGYELAGHVTVGNVRALELWPEVFRDRAVILRVDPGHGRGHHKYVRTAGSASKFGIAPEDLPLLQNIAKEHNIQITGLHAHVGSGILTPDTWSSIAYALASIAEKFPHVTHLNVGGGFGVPEKPGAIPLNLTVLEESLQQFRETYSQFELWIEPGRYLVAGSGVLLVRVTQVKRKGSTYYIGVETGMNSLIRPALYGSYHSIVNLSKLGETPSMTADIVGPICETGDILGRARRLPETKEGDILLITTTGAYGRVMSSSYNMRDPAAEVVI
ncbi:MAG: bifunctional aspartate kinase/diaminopimelate decarboxylase [Rhodothermaceae bacterium]|nr:bifunctional aspartate kinase/diaminopimelate decarboxylase [Rhodothermaceae bacterium]MXZ59093.1 bifunctional aspartate kinase/diaminopimelate decarboxylase [Rhodothermaceae bacterium]MYB90328.1 bifunctional aspartate kinase/diaminopimelate decarboxylase [Rhodothermaceae bacterium]MYD68496.1 bifunctional aspartate kinase/diaminopimelate decarboxylase [Rhodothermaceae bacterium]MYG45627.1 bifunctional aspartate kinase/diaminopimelate decarboxylase [Rhodothermaceae bacterium]